MLDKKTKEKILKKFGIHAHDTGSMEVQIAILTFEIQELIKHLKDHKKDFSSRYGLLKKVGERRRFLKYLERTNNTSFLDISKKLKLKIANHPVKEHSVKTKNILKNLDEESVKIV